MTTLWFRDGQSSIKRDPVLLRHRTNGHTYGATEFVRFDRRTQVYMFQCFIMAQFEAVKLNCCGWVLMNCVEPHHRKSRPNQPGNWKLDDGDSAIWTGISFLHVRRKTDGVRCLSNITDTSNDNLVHTHSRYTAKWVNTDWEWFLAEDRRESAL